MNKLQRPEKKGELPPALSGRPTPAPHGRGFG